jgi:DNA-binding XRE family transcriptional regulator
MKKFFNNNLLLIVLSNTLFIGGYFFLRLAYNASDKMPFTQEFILIILGTISTILITAILLNKQTSVEIEKEQSVKFLDLKTTIYKNLINTIEEIIISRDITEKEIIKLKFHSHRLAIVASPDVLAEYRNFLDTFDSKVTIDKEVSIDDADILSQALAKLTIYIRADLVGELDLKSGEKPKNIANQIMENSK